MNGASRDLAQRQAALLAYLAGEHGQNDCTCPIGAVEVMVRRVWPTHTTDDRALEEFAGVADPGDYVRIT